MFKKSFILLACAILIPCSLSSAQSGVSEYGSGVHQYFSGRHQTAISTLNDAIAADSKNARAYYFRGLAKMGSGDSYGAKSDFEMGALVEASSLASTTGPSSSKMCALVPPTPNELTPARRGSSPRFHSRLASQTKNGLFVKSISGFGFS